MSTSMVPSTPLMFAVGLSSPSMRFTPVGSVCADACSSMSGSTYATRGSRSMRSAACGDIIAE